MAWKVFSVVAGVSSFFAASSGVTDFRGSAIEVVLGLLGSVFIAMTVFHYVLTLPANRRSDQAPERPRSEDMLTVDTAQGRLRNSER